MRQIVAWKENEFFQEITGFDIPFPVFISEKGEMEYLME